MNIIAAAVATVDGELYYVPGAALSTLDYLKQPYEIGNTISLILQMSKMKFYVVMCFV